jgi:hypothetical protein
MRRLVQRALRVRPVIRTACRSLNTLASKRPVAATSLTANSGFRSQYVAVLPCALRLACFSHLPPAASQVRAGALVRH